MSQERGDEGVWDSAGGGYDVTYGPKAEVHDLPAFEWAVKQTYGGQLRGPQLWRGMITLFYEGKEFGDFEAQLIQSKTGDPFISLPQRSYEAQNGGMKYKAQVWLSMNNVKDAAAEAVRLELGDSSAEEEDDGPPV